MAEYYLKWTDTGEKEKTIYINQKNSAGAGDTSALLITVVNQDGTPVNITGMTTSNKLYIGTEGALELDGGAMTVVSAAVGTLIFRLGGEDFSPKGIMLRAVEKYNVENPLFGDMEI